MLVCWLFSLLYTSGTSIPHGCICLCIPLCPLRHCSTQSAALLKKHAKNHNIAAQKKRGDRYNFNESSSLKRSVQHHLVSFAFSIYFWLRWERLLQVHLQTELKNNHKYNKNLGKHLYDDAGLPNVGAKYCYHSCKLLLVFTSLKKCFKGPFRSLPWCSRWHSLLLPWARTRADKLWLNRPVSTAINPNLRLKPPFHKSDSSFFLPVTAKRSTKMQIYVAFKKSTKINLYFLLYHCYSSRLFIIYFFLGISHSSASFLFPTFSFPSLYNFCFPLSSFHKVFFPFLALFSIPNFSSHAP